MTGLRVLLYAHDTYGLGHLRRSLAIGTQLLGSLPGATVVLATGSPVADCFGIPAGLRLVRLPSVVKVGPEDYRPRDTRISLAEVRAARTAAIAGAVGALQPDILLVDHAPQGMKNELLPIFEALPELSPGTRVVLGLRDVLDDPQTVRELWAEQGIYETLDRVYHRILVYGCQHLLDQAVALDLPPAVAARVTHCGYVGRPPVSPAERVADLPPGSPFVLGTAGGGGDGRAVLAATAEASAGLGIPVVITTGPLMDSADRAAVAAVAADAPHARVVEFLPNLPGVMAAASVVVTMGGYNSLVEVAAAGAPAVVVPRVYPRREQAIRAELFARHGLVRVVAPGPGLAERLAPAIAGALGEPRRQAPWLDLSGASRLVDVLVDERELVCA